MPELNVFSAIGQESEKTLNRLMDNVDLVRVVMGIVSLVALVAQERGKNLQGVRIGRVQMTETRMIAKVCFSDLSIMRKSHQIPSVNSFIKFLKQEAEGLYLFIVKNPDWLNWMQDVIEHMEAYARHNGKLFSDLTFGDRKKIGGASSAFLDKEDNIVLDLDDVKRM